MDAQHVVSLAASTLVLGGLIGCAARRLYGTTLFAPLLWAGGATLAVASLGMAEATGLVVPHPASPLRYAVAVTTLCPMMALLGAKRPQDRAWQWVVLSLLATLWLPAARWWLLDPGESMELFAGWQVFLMVLLLLGPLNYLPTRNWLPAILVAVGQWLLLQPFLTSFGEINHRFPSTGLACFAVAAVWTWIATWLRRQRQQPPPSTVPTLHMLDVSWRRFRDAFGAFWALRVLQRVNQGVASTQPRLTLTWYGWLRPQEETVDSKVPGAKLDEALVQAGRAMQTTLRRFIPR